MGLALMRLWMVNMDFICKLCTERFIDQKLFQGHLKKNHSLRLIEYYQQHEPRYDLFDNSIIKFKTIEQYLSQDFNTRTNLKKWLEKQPIEVQKSYCKDLLLERKTRKNLIYAPSQVELKTLLMPAVPFYDKIFGSYYELCESIRLVNKYKMAASIDKLEYKGNIRCDSREQNLLKFDKIVSIEKLEYGDYAPSDEKLSGLIAIERKSLSDLLGTLSGGYERFQRELKRSEKDNHSLVILVEEKFFNLMSFPYLPHIHSKCNVEFITHRVREICQTFKNVQFLFVNGRKEAAAMVERLFCGDRLFEKHDLQLCYDLKLI